MDELQNGMQTKQVEGAVPNRWTCLHMHEAFGGEYGLDVPPCHHLEDGRLWCKICVFQKLQECG